ncbi:MmgE/PrpD family protein [Conexibacter sp. S30A1]|uniref:MmgE/PrpD family protein n=1 Tax=Conexibacter sp. S30A1 TaxID=2937800 RepID=UPI00200F0C12|nr:MmgE/PrpD family protein [Conexibacter sp. S30A1]
MTNAARKNLTLALADYASATTVEDMPEEVRERGRQIVMDELACAAFGQTRPAGQLATQYVASIGGPGPCRVLGTAVRTTAPYAALANGTAGHADEVDGAHVVGGHPGATIVQAVAAASEHRRATGADLLNGVVLGYEIGNRLIRACGGVFGVKSRLHLHADFLHAIGAASAVSRVLGLDAERLSHAMALATFQANGLCSLFQERRHISKSFCNGQYASAGISAALLAAAGFEGCEDVIGAADGALEAWGLQDARDILMEGLGADFAVMGANFKFTNAGYPIHAVVEAAMTLVAEHSIDPQDIRGVEVGMPTNAMRVVDSRKMHNICVQDMLGAALAQGGLSLRTSPFPKILEDDLYQRIRAVIVVAPDAELDAELPNGRGARVQIVTRDGAAVVHRVDWPRGHSARGGTTWQDLAGKWRDALPTLDVDTLVSLCQGLENIDDVDELLRIFDGAASA